MLAAHGANAAAVSRDDGGALAAVDLHDGKTSLAAHSFVLEDDTGDLQFEDVRDTTEHPLRPLASEGENLGHSRSVYWLCFRVRNTLPSSSFIIELSRTPEVAELYDGIAPPRRSGTSLPFRERDVEYPEIAFRIALAPGEERSFWIRQRSNDTVELSPVMWTERAFWESRSGDHLLNGLCYGVIIGLAVYNLFLFLATRDRSYFLYIVFQVTNGLTQAALEHYTFQYLWPDHPAWAARSVAVLEFLAFAAALAFARAFLDTRRRSPRLDAALRVAWITDLALAAVWVLADPDALQMLGGRDFLDSLVVSLALLGSVLALLSSLLVTVAAIAAAARPGATNARVFLVAWAVLLVGGLSGALTVLGVIWLDGFALLKVGSAVEAVLLSLALASRISGLMRDRERAQHETLAAKVARIAALRQLVSGVAHEVGNPLNFACGGSDELASQLDAIERSAPGAAGPARSAHRLVASGLARIKLILDNLRRYLSVGDADAIPTDLAHELDQVLELTAERRASAGVAVERQIAPLPVLRARPGELHQVMLNLIVNAIEAMPRGGTLRVTACAIDSSVEMAVTDTGPGVEVADRERIFEPFFTTRRAAGGTGLGLAVAREIVERHGGTLRVETGDGGGARFVVSLPCVQGEGTPGGEPGGEPGREDDG